MNGKVSALPYCDDFVQLQLDEHADTCRQSFEPDLGRVPPHQIAESLGPNHGER